jgi:lysozyme
MNGMMPKSKPQATRADILALALSAGLRQRESVLFILGIRGYYRNTMGLPGVNDRGIYDDAIFVVGPDFFAAYNGNTDPSRIRKGQGKGVGKGMASLSSGVWRAHQLGKHKGQYEALIQTGGPVTVIRDGNPPYEDSGYFGINIHKGGFNTTNSEGCQTLHPNQWNSFIAGVTDQVKRIHGTKWRSATIPYVLVESLLR